MANRRYAQFDDRKVCGKPEPPPNGRRGPKATLPKESTAQWPEMRKERRSDRGYGMKAIKVFVAGGYMPSGDSNWIAGAIEKPGAFTVKAKRAGQSVASYAQDKRNAPGTLGKQARLAITLRKMR